MALTRPRHSGRASASVVATGAVPAGAAPVSSVTGGSAGSPSVVGAPRSGIASTSLSRTRCWNTGSSASSLPRR